MNVQNAPVHDMASVVKLETPPAWSRKLGSFNIEKAYQFREASHILFIVWRGLILFANSTMVCH